MTLQFIVLNSLNCFLSCQFFPFFNLQFTLCCILCIKMLQWFIMLTADIDSYSISVISVLSVAFNIVDHIIPSNCLKTWVGLKGTALSL